jgi:hypothetical protein
MVTIRPRGYRSSERYSPKKSARDEGIDTSPRSALQDMPQAPGYLGLPMIISRMRKRGRTFRHDNSEPALRALVQEALPERAESIERVGQANGRIHYQATTEKSKYQVDIRSNGSKVISVKDLNADRF